MDYKTSGVDIEAGYKSVELMKEHVKKTMREEVLGGLGGFSGAFSLAKIKEMEEPVLQYLHQMSYNPSDNPPYIIISYNFYSLFPAVLRPLLRPDLSFPLYKLSACQEARALTQPESSQPEYLHWLRR